MIPAPPNPLLCNALAWKFAHKAIHRIHAADPAIDAEDLAQSILLDLTRAAKTYDPKRAKFITLAWTYARNAIHNETRHLIRRGRMTTLAIDVGRKPDHSVEDTDQCESLMRCLTERERDIVTRHMQGEKFKAIAASYHFHRQWISLIFHAALDKMRRAARRAA